MSAAVIISRALSEMNDESYHPSGRVQQQRNGDGYKSKDYSSLAVEPEDQTNAQNINSENLSSLCNTKRG